MPEMMDRGGNPDAPQDEELIRSVLQRELSPVFEAIRSRLEDYDKDLTEVKDLLMKFTEGLIGAADNHRRTSLSDEISSKYGADIEPFEEFHKSVYGKGMKDTLLEALMGENAPGDEERDSWIKDRLNNAKGLYGKYVGLKVDDQPPMEMQETGEIPAEGEAKEGEEEARAGEAEEKKGEEEERAGGMKEGELEEEKGEAEEEAGEGEEEDAIAKLMREMSSLTGARHGLGEALSPKKRKAPARRA
jgi:hypothetical protein